MFLTDHPPHSQESSTFFPPYFVQNETTKIYVVFIIFMLPRNGPSPSLLPHDATWYLPGHVPYLQHSVFALSTAQMLQNEPAKPLQTHWVGQHHPNNSGKRS